jgi:alkyl-hydroperoxide reductase/thiol specific antioxidant family protein
MSDDLADQLASRRTTDGRTLAALSFEHPTLVVFLRHFGCTFCREAVATLAAREGRIGDRRMHVAFVHIESEEEAAPFFERYDAAAMPRVSDPDQRLYRSAGFGRMGVRDLLSPSLWWRGIDPARRYGFAVPTSDVWQLGGVLVLENGRVTQCFVPGSPADRPDYDNLAACAVSPAAG